MNWESPRLRVFRSHLFPMGHFPAPSATPATQLPAADEEFALFVRAPLGDHPMVDLVGFDVPTGPVEVGPDVEHGFDAGYAPCGELNETEWRRRFLVRPATTRTGAEYLWPPAASHPEGGLAPGEAVVLPPGTRLDRYGSPEGRLVIEPDTPAAACSVPPEFLSRGLRRFTVVKALPTWCSVAAPWFGQPGGGRRHRLTHPIIELIAAGGLRPHSESEGATGPIRAEVPT